MNNFQGQSYFFVLKNNAIKPLPTGRSHWLEFIPNHMYLFLPSYEADKGKVKVYDFIPRQVTDFMYCMKVEKV